MKKLSLILLVMFLAGCSCEEYGALKKEIQIHKTGSILVISKDWSPKILLYEFNYEGIKLTRNGNGYLCNRTIQLSDGTESSVYDKKWLYKNDFYDDTSIKDIPLRELKIISPQHQILTVYAKKETEKAYFVNSEIGWIFKKPPKEYIGNCYQVYPVEIEK